MDQLVEDLRRRPLYVYDLPGDILATLQRREGTDADVDGVRKESEDTPSKKDQTQPNTGSKACSLCNVAFPTVEEQRSHVRSDFHGYNLKQKLRGLQPVSESDFETLIGDLDESLSGSDSDESEEEDMNGNTRETVLTSLLKKQAGIIGDNKDPLDDPTPNKRNRGSGKPPLFWFKTPSLPKNINLGIYRAIFTNTEQENESGLVDTVRRKQLLPKQLPKHHSTTMPLDQEMKSPHIFLCMIGGGHFAAMVVSLSPRQAKGSTIGRHAREATVLVHKTFHRYTTRRKQGGAQSANDSAKGAAHSAGSSLRRYNEAALTDEIRLLLSDWKGLIDSSELVFIRASGNTSRRTLLGPYEGQVLRHNDPRIRGFPFNTRRATQHELMRAFVELTRVKIEEIDEAATVAIAAKHVKPLTDKNKPPSGPIKKLTEDEETRLQHTAQLQALTRRSKLPALFSYLKINSLSADFLFYPPDSRQNHHAPTLLHLAASQNSSTLVSGLLMRADASPIILNGDGNPAFDLAGDRSTRDSFRVSRSALGESRWDWAAAHVPSALSVSEAEQRELREQQEKSQQEEKRRQAEMERLKLEGPKVPEMEPLGKAAGRGKALALGQVQKTAEEKREQDMRGMTPEMRSRLERERRARAAEDRIRRLQSGV